MERRTELEDILELSLRDTAPVENDSSWSRGFLLNSFLVALVKRDMGNSHGLEIVDDITTRSLNPTVCDVFRSLGISVADEGRE